MKLGDLLKNIRGICGEKETEIGINFRQVINEDLIGQDGYDCWLGNAIYKNGVISTSDGDSWTTNENVRFWCSNDCNSISVWIA